MATLSFFVFVQDKVIGVHVDRMILIESFFVYSIGWFINEYIFFIQLLIFTSDEDQIYIDMNSFESKFDN